jgi:hypothetical protein
MIVAMCLGFAACQEAPEEGMQSEESEQGLMSCNDCNKDNCEQRCSQSNGEVRLCSFIIQNKCSGNGGFEDPKDPRPSPPPGGPGGPNQCPLFECQPEGHGKVVAARHVWRTEVDPDRTPGRRPEATQVPYTIYTYAHQQWARRSNHSPGCLPVRCCDKLTPHQVPGHTGEFNHGQRCQY